MLENLRYGFIGCGMMGQEHIPNLSMISCAKINVIYEPNEKMRSKISILIPQARFVETEEEVIEMANSTKYGLSASIFTRDVSKAHRVAANIDSGIVWINTWLLRDLRIPFGGMKDSGVGREGGFKSLEFFTEPKNICVKI